MVGIRGVVAALHDLHHMLQVEERLYFDHCCSCILTYSYVSKTRTRRRVALNMMKELSVLYIINQFQHQSVFYSSGSAPSYRDFNIIILHWSCSCSDGIVDTLCSQRSCSEIYCFCLLSLYHVY